ncbi:MAG: hypothetical protein ACRDNZ_17310, partial [Streptosporangiaceae bacterium]
MARRDVRAGPTVSLAPPALRASQTSRTSRVLAARAESVVRRYWPAVVAVAVMTGLGLWGLARDSAMGNDEVATRWAASLSLPQLAHLLRHVDAVHGSYYLLMHAWMAVGTSPAALRVPSVIAMAGAVALIAILGQRLTGSAWAGLFAGLITALTPAISYYGQTARSYALVFASVTAATLVLVRALQSAAPQSAPQPAAPQPAPQPAVPQSAPGAP